MENFDLRKYLAENKLLKEDTNLTMNQLEKLANIKSDEFNSSPDKLVDMVMGSVKYNLEKDGTNIENASEDEIDKLRYKWARLKGLLKVKDTFTSMYGKRGVKTNTDKDLLDKTLRENKLLKEYLDLEIDEDQVTINSYSGEYSGFIEDDNTVDFSVTGYEEERENDAFDFDEDNWKDILGPKHAFVKISNQIPTTKVEAAGDYVMITVDLEDLKAIAD